MTRRQALEHAAAAVMERERRRKEHPLAYAVLWDNPEPKTSQLRAFRDALAGAVVGLYLSGGNGTGKTWCGAVFALLQALGGDHPDVIGFCSRNGLDRSRIPTGPGRVWVCSPTFDAARDQIRRHLRELAPVGTERRGWDATEEGELHLPGGGVIVSKAYKQYVGNSDTWEGAQIRAVVFDEHPPTRECMGAAFARTRSVKIPGQPDAPQRWFWMLALTNLRGKNWLYKAYKHAPKPEVPVRALYSAHNPHLDQRQHAALIAETPKWQHAARERGEETAPEGAVFALDFVVHRAEVTPGEDWIHWMGIDWGARSPHVLWACEPPGGEGPVYVYREYAPRRTSIEPGISDRELIQHARHLEGDEGAIPWVEWSQSRPLVLRVGDSESPGAIQEAAEQGLLVAPALKPKGSVRRGLDLISAMLATTHPITGVEQRPRLFISEHCPQLWEEMSGLHWPATIGERQDADEVHPLGADHGPDALRYLLMERDRLGFR